MGRGELAGLFSDLVRLETELWDAVDMRLREAHALPLSWFEPIQVIERTARCRVNDIAAALSITVGGTSKLVDRLEGAGLCGRQPDPEDGRSSLIALTGAGRQLFADATRTFEAVLETNLGSTLSPRSLDQLAATIHKLRQGLRGHHGARNA